MNSESASSHDSREGGLTLMELARFVLPTNIVSIESTKGVDQNAGDCFDVQTYRLVCIVHEGPVIEEHIA